MKENVRPYWESRGSNSSYWTYTETKERFYTQRETGKNEIDLLRGEVQKNRRVVSEKVEESGSRLVEISKEL